MLPACSVVARDQRGARGILKFGAGESVSPQILFFPRVLFDATSSREGKIVGATGLTLALAKERGLEGVCLLGATTGFKADRGAGFSVFRFLMKALGNEVKEGL